MLTLLSPTKIPEKSLNIHAISIGGDSHMKVALIANLEFEPRKQPSEAASSMISAINSISAKYSLNSVIIIGQLLYPKAPSPAVFMGLLIRGLMDGPCDVFLLPPAKELKIISSLDWIDPNKVHVIGSDALQFTVQTNKPKNFFVTGNLNIPIFPAEDATYRCELMMKEKFISKIQRNDWLICGFSRSPFVEPAMKIGNVGTFNYDPQKSEYGILEMGATNSFSIFTSIK